MSNSFIVTLNEIWGAGLEPLVWLLGLTSFSVGLYYYVLPDFIAVAFHDGENWLDQRTFWSARKDFELFGKAEAGILFGRFVKDNEVRIPRIPKPKFFQLRLFGAKRGIYRVMPVRVLPDGLEFLEKEGPFPRNSSPRFAFQEADEGLALK